MGTEEKKYIKKENL